MVELAGLETKLLDGSTDADTVGQRQGLGFEVLRVVGMGPLHRRCLPCHRLPRVSLLSE